MTAKNSATGGIQPLLQQHTVNGRTLWCWQPGEDAPDGPAMPGGKAGAALPLVIMPADEGAAEELAQALPMVQQALRAGRCRPFLLASFACDDWNRDCSP